MVIGEKFAWTHIGKSAGDTTHNLFNVFKPYLKRIDPPGQAAKHSPFSRCLEDIKGKSLALNIRRLPCYILGKVIHHRVKPKKKDYLDLNSDFKAHFGNYDECGLTRLSTLPDTMLNAYTMDGNLKIDHWLRTESLRWDFTDFISKFFDISAEQYKGIFSVPGKGGHWYNHNIFDFFSRDEIKQMYENNSFWATVEKQVYGNHTYDMEVDEFLEHIKYSFPKKPYQFEIPL